MHHIFVKANFVDLDNKLITVDKTDDFENYNHLVNSLRVKVGEQVLCSVMPFISTFDYKTSVTSIDKEKVSLKIEESVEGNELPVKLNLYQGLAKSDKLEFIIEKAVELGVASVVPLVVKNAVVKIDKDDKKYQNKNIRYNKIARSAAEQSKRHVIPEVYEPLTIKEAINNTKNDYNIVFYENANDINYTKEVIELIKKDMISKTSAEGTSQVNIFIGPEGGYTEDEISEMKSAGFYILTLGKRILRTETAALAAITLFMYEFEK
jgi:16S rRNA (uracil1498-N3)-methyltransferase